MADVVVVLGVIAFFAISALFVFACDRIIGPDETARADEPGASGTDEVASLGGAR
jgi:hypothetical protein